MAAKQGLTAHLSQAGEDAKRAVLSRTGVTSSWFSNLNTVCTIKSAPPRTPEVLQMLSTKSGWLYKRNEQHVWQARWCCVVPHMFLYYFDADIGVGLSADASHPGGVPQNPPQLHQDEWNKAVQTGYGNRKQHEKRTGLYLFNQSSTPAAAVPETAIHDVDGGGLNASGTADTSKFTSLQPAGIIDLECYTSLHRSSENSHVLELAGDDQVNPDLRAFYFCAPTAEESDDWNSALLNQRHAALLDECDAYKQVCEGFAQQLQVLHADLDQSTAVASEAQDELYRVRSQHEDHRRSTWRMLEDFCEKPAHESVEAKRRELRRNLETIRSQDLGVQAAVRMLLEYSDGLEAVAVDWHEEGERLEQTLQQTGQSDQAKVQELEGELEVLKAKFEQEKKQWESQFEAATQKQEQSQKELADVQKDLVSTRMEITMYQSQQKTKISELQQHKKILKKEVLDLRGKLDNANSELGLVQHQQENHQLRAEQERQKAALLERYVEKVESQVKVQQNMMEMMSASGSVHGGSVGTYDHYSPHSRGNVVYVQAAEEEDDEEDEDRFIPLETTHRRRHLDDVDNKSHVSELTEDRTQRHLDVFQSNEAYYTEYNGPSPRSSPLSIHKKAARTSPRASPRKPGPPPYIIDMSAENEKLPHGGRPLGSSQSVTGTPPLMRRGEVARRSAPRDVRDSNSVASETKKLSVAQRARLEADRRSKPVKVRLDSQSVKSMSDSVRSNHVISPSQLAQQGRSTSDSVSQGSMWQRMEDALIGPKPEDMFSSEDDDDASSNRSTHVTDYTDTSRRTRESRREDSEEKKTNDSMAVSRGSRTFLNSWKSRISPFLGNTESLVGRAISNSTCQAAQFSKESRSDTRRVGNSRGCRGILRCR
jgi:hypothetical protein